MARYLGSTLAWLSGFLLWALSPMIIHRREPWDAEWPFYLVVIVIAGAVAGLFGTNRLQTVAWVWAGQVTALATVVGREWFPLGVITTGIGSSLSLLGWAAVSVIRRLLKLS